jgi:phosphoribosylaminoimidazolecarboxamide formyltransferase/IMP cyclohydrolase
MSSSPNVLHAILSVSDKQGLAPFARGLVEANVKLFSTGGTRKHLEAEGIPVQDIAAYTGFPEMMDGRLKTLHPKVHGGILCRHNQPEDMESLAAHGILTFELVVVNLYPFEATIARDNVSDDEAIEQIDIGGPTMVRAAAKNHAFTTIATHPRQYAEILQQIRAERHTTRELRRRLAGEAFDHTARYDRAIADYFARHGAEPTEFPPAMSASYRLKEVLRYGENPHQRAAVYADPTFKGPSVVAAEQLNGKELSYNNLLDLESALEIVRGFQPPAAVVIKHNNPCGAAIADRLDVALGRAMEGDPLSAFGSVLGLNRTVDAATAELLCAPGLFVEAIIAPDFALEALEMLTTRPKWKANVRLLKAGPFGPSPAHRAGRHLGGGLLLQDADVLADPESEWNVVTDAKPTDSQLSDLRFAWALVRHVKSNAITLCKNAMLLGTGAGQMSRVDSTEIAIKKAGDRVAGSVMGSDAFFPFPDSIETAAAAGVAAVIQPGGSRKDDEAIAACNKHGIPMIFTARRHFKH